MKFANVVVVGLVVLGTFGLVFACQTGSSVDSSSTNLNGVVVGQSCPGMLYHVSPVCEVAASSIGCVTKYEKKQIRVQLEGGGFGIQLVDDTTKPLGCEPSPVDYHERCYNQAGNTQSPAMMVVESSLYTDNYRNGPQRACTNKRTVYKCVSEPVIWWLPLGKRHCVGKAQKEKETCPATYPTVVEGC